ncbi:MAG: polysaccharide biosynthesis protein [Clostridia bacterium]|nr:polysaccharide biosynthesis protein [Clostridia bacterium]
MNNALKRTILVFIDVLIVAFSLISAIYLSLGDLRDCLSEWWFILAAGLTTVAINFCLGLYNKILKYVGIADVAKLVLASFAEIIVFGVIAMVSVNYSLEWFVICSVFYSILLVASRISIKALEIIERAVKAPTVRKALPHVMVIGAGDAGNIIINEMRSSDKISLLPVCVLDDDPKKIGREINGVKIVGRIDEVEKYAKEYHVDQIVIAMPSVDRKTVRDIIVKCQKTKCKIRTLPGIYQMLTGAVSVSDVKDVDVADLLGREQVRVNLDEILGYIENRVVMITGGGGSIGSELCRQIATHNPKQLIIVDIYENNAYDIQQELVRQHPELNLEVRIASVRDKARVDSLFAEFKPEIVFHAAAHKHVPLMEDSPNEAIKNNVGGTYNVADAAGRFGADKFVLISTDKAVNPTNIMGASKRICEMIAQTMDKTYKTTYVAVRFGNVLGSNGSVIPLFTKQIAEGGPITLTHKDIVRYFMTIPEAVSLVLQAGAYAKGGEIFVLDMGEPVKIYDLAVNMIRLSGLELFKDIDIKIVGLRPGEKLYEERLMAEEGLLKTANDMISIGKPIKFNDEGFFDKIKSLVNTAKEETDGIKTKVAELVPTYKNGKK